MVAAAGAAPGIAAIVPDTTTAGALCFVDLHSAQ
jgi:hypothetical protein